MKKSHEVIVCEKCKGIYKLKEGESLDNFINCECGGKLKYIEPWNKTKKSKKNKIILPLIVVAFIITSGFAIYEFSNIEGIIFDMIPYNYTSHVWMPPKSDSSGSLGGFYNIQGQGRDFTFTIKLPGAEKAESPLDYTEDGLHGTGRIDTIEITFNTIQSLISRDFKKAMFETRFSGDFNMSCAAWTGAGTFSSANGTIPGTFKIDGPMTDWEGIFVIKNENNKIILRMDFINYPNGQKDKAVQSYDIIYM